MHTGHFIMWQVLIVWREKEKALNATTPRITFVVVYYFLEKIYASLMRNCMYVEL